MFVISRPAQIKQSFPKEVTFELRCERQVGLYLREERMGTKKRDFYGN